MVRKTNLIIFFAFAPLLIFSQNLITGKISDKDSNIPVDFVNIGIVDKAKGTVSDFDGSFSFDLNSDDINEKDTVQFSRIGYKTLTFSTFDIQRELEASPIIKMEASRFELNEVVINNNDLHKNRIGYESTSKNLFGFWNDSLALGGEHASKIKVRKGPVKLEDLSFNIIASISDSLLVRVNVYEIEKGLPGKNISNRNILHTIKQKQGKVIINLSPYNIIVRDDFIVSLELLKIYGDKVTIAISAYNDGYRSYTRLLSQDRWRRIKKGTTIAYNLNTSKVEEADILDNRIDDNLRKRPEVVTILWDNSFSMQDRDLEEELRFLKTYFNKLGDTKVKFRTFGHSLGKRMEYSIEKGNWKALEEHIRTIVYDGAASDEVLKELPIDEHTLLFTDGKGFSEETDSDWRGTAFTINSQADGNHSLLKSLAEGTGANYINLDKVNDMALVVSYTQKYIVDNLEYDSKGGTDLRIREIRGNISDFDDPLANATIRVKGTDRKTKTNINGNFVIPAKTGETLEFSYPGREADQALINSSTTMLNVVMPIGVKLLDEVTVSEKRKLEKISPMGKEKVTTNFGTLNPEAIGFSVKQLTTDDIDLSNGSVLSAIVGRFPGVEVVGSKVVVRKGFLRLQSLEPIGAGWDIDGLIYDQNTDVNLIIGNISLSNVKSITIMPPAWSAARYGSLGKAGMVIVRTISQSFDEVENENSLADQALLRNNKYLDNAKLPEERMESLPGYLIAISSANTVDEAYERYLERRKVYGHLPFFYADVHDLFVDRWESEELAKRILSNIAEQFSDDVAAMRLLAYKLEENGRFAEALSAYRHIFNLKPSQAQSHRDLGQALVKTGNRKEAWKVYSDYLRNRKEDLTDEGIDKIISDEMLALLEEHNVEIGMDVSSFSFKEEKSDIVLTMEWDNPNVEFELQFVNPKNKYYTWKHSKESESSLLEDERLKGYSSHSFEIPNVGNGEWMVNIKYLGNSENTPSHIKCTIKDNRIGIETIEVQQVRKKNVNYRFLSFTPDLVIFN